MALEKPSELHERDADWTALAAFATRPAIGASLGLLYGRRRQGKTFMLELLARETGGFLFIATEQYGRENLEALSAAYRAYVATGEPVRFADWREAIDALFRLGERTSKPTLVVLDEFQYLLDNEPGLASFIQIAMSPLGRAMTQSRTRLILCGSALTTMRRLLLGSAPLRGRATLEINLPTLDFRQAAHFWGLASDPELAFKIDALVGGTPAYLGMSDGPVNGDRDFAEWVVRGLLSPRSAMFREGNILLYEQPDVTDAKLYFSVLNAIAGGAARRSEIAGRLGRPDSSLSHTLAVLEEIQLILKTEDAITDRRPTYRVAEPVIRFHQLIARSRERLIVANGGRRVWESVQDTVDSKIYGPHFEDIAREWTLKYADQQTLGFPTDVRPAVIACREHEQSHELDVVAISELSYEPKRVLAIGEAKATTTPVGEAVLARLEHLRDLLPSDKVDGLVKLLIFARTGFTVELRRLASARSDLELVDLGRLYGGA